MDPNSSDEGKKLAYASLAMSAIPIKGQLAAVGTKLGAKVLTQAEAKALAKLYVKDYSSKTLDNLTTVEGQSETRLHTQTRS
ncbi:MAG: hypothetical protein WD469_03780 [Paenibacillaceae bacterium]